MYVNYIDGVNLYGCLFYIDILEDLKSLAPLISVFGVDDNNGDFGSIFYDYYGNVGPLQTSNMFFTLVNTTGTTSIEAILKGQQNVTRPSPQVSALFVVAHSLTSSRPHLLTSRYSHWKLDSLQRDSRFQGLSGDHRRVFGHFLFPRFIFRDSMSPASSSCTPVVEAIAS